MGQNAKYQYTNSAVELCLLDDRPRLGRTVLQIVLEWYDVPKQV